MIKNEVALKYLYKLKHNSELNTPMGARNNYTDSLDVGIFNTIKQIPKSVKIIHPYEEDKNFIYKVCPSCDTNNSIWLLHETPAIKYCMWCGQALIWDDKNEIN